MDTTLQVRQQGVLTLPAEFRQNYGNKAGNTFRLVDKVVPTPTETEIDPYKEVCSHDLSGYWEEFSPHSEHKQVLLLHARYIKM